MSKIKLIELNDLPIQLIDGDRGVNYPSKSEFTNDGYCVFLNTGNVTKAGFDFSNIEFINEERDLLLRKGKLQFNDIVLTTRGTVGNVGFYHNKNTFKHIRINSGMIILRCDENKIYPYYLFLFLRSKIFKKQVLDQSSGSAQPQLPISSLKNISFPYYKLETQQKIAKVLSDLDAKIELNNRINTELEATAKTLYDYWFVQFDFPYVTSSGVEKPYKTSGGKMVWNKGLKREIPEGWESGILQDLCNKIGDGIHGTPNYVEHSEYSFINGNNLKNGFIQTDNETKKVSEEEYKKYFIQLNENTILLSINGTLGNLAVYTGEKVMLGKSSAYINCNENNRAYCFQFLKQDHMPNLFWNIATGSTIKNLSLDSIKKLSILIPNNDLITQFYTKTKSIDDKRINIFRENQELASLRDWLLPMLMNGQVRVSDVAEKFGMVAEESARYGK